MNIDQLGEAILDKTDQMLINAEEWQYPHVIGQRIQELNGMLELASYAASRSWKQKYKGTLTICTTNSNTNIAA